MRIVPAVTALLVCAVIYLMVFEREATLRFAQGEGFVSGQAADGQETAKDEAGASSATVVIAEETAPDGQARPKIGVVVLRSQAQEIDSAVILRGQTEAHRQVEVRAETSARVISEPLRRGAFVEAGQLLCQLDPGTREAALTEARARLSEAKSHVPEAEARLSEALARLDESRIEENAARKLSEGGFASDVRVAAAEAAVKSAEAAVAAAESGLEAARSGIESAQAAVAAAETEIERLTIKAPFAGLLEADTAELGSLMQPGSLCATVIQLDPIKLVGFVSETEVNRIAIGARAGARLATGELVQGRVVFLSRSADPTTRTFEVEIEVPNPELKIRDGQTAEIMISAEGARAHRLPQSALTLNNEGRLGVRIVDENHIVQFMPVQLLRDTVEGVWVSGLPDTADVIVVGQDFVTAGVPVAVSYQDQEAGQ